MLSPARIFSREISACAGAPAGAGDGAQQAVDAHADGEAGARRLDVDVAGAQVDRLLDQRVERPHHRRAAREIAQVVEALLRRGAVRRGLAELGRLAAASSAMAMSSNEATSASAFVSSAISTARSASASLGSAIATRTRPSASANGKIAASRRKRSLMPRGRACADINCASEARSSPKLSATSSANSCAERSLASNTARSGRGVAAADALGRDQAARDQRRRQSRSGVVGAALVRMKQS